MSTVSRSFLTVLTCLAVAVAACQAGEPWIIDTHTHFKGEVQIAREAKRIERDPRNTLGHVVVPEDYRGLADRLNIQATVIVEAVDQADPEFNDWVLKQAASELICGYIARGDLTSAEFGERYERYRKSGYLRGYRFRMDELNGYLKSDAARANLKRLEADGMVVDLLIDSQHADDVVALSRDFPKLTIVIDHCFRARLKDGRPTPEWVEAVHKCGKLPNVACKLSSILNFAETPAFSEPAPTDLKTYEPILQTCFEAFGEDRVLFATNWAVCTHYGKVDDVVKIVSTFLKSKGETAFKKGMRENAIRIFKIRTEQMRGEI